jgi:acyl carrier protein
MSDALNAAVMAGLQAYIPAGQNALPLASDTALGSLGINSLQLVELAYELEVRFGLQVDEEQLVQLQTVGDLQAMFVTARQEESGKETRP